MSDQFWPDTSGAGFPEKQGQTARQKRIDGFFNKTRLINAAKAGVLGAMNELALRYETGDGVIERDEGKAVEWFSKAAKDGHIAATFNLGVCIERGVGIEKDEAKAVELFTKVTIPRSGP